MLLIYLYLLRNLCGFFYQYNLKINVLNQLKITTMSKFSDLINKSDIPVLVDYYADWCGPCKHMESVLKSVAAKLEDKLRVIKVDVDKNQAVSQLYKIQSIPTMMLFYKGKVLWRQSGAMPEQVLLQHLTPHLTAKV